MTLTWRVSPDRRGNRSSSPIGMLAILEQKLKMSHSDAALGEIKAFSEGLKTSTQRLTIFNADRAIVQPPICPQIAKTLGFNQPDESFTLLQGDIVTTESAFFLGERVTGSPKYVVLNSSCDLMPERREYAALLRITQISKSEEDAGAKVSYLLKFANSASMYLPPLPTDSSEVVCNAIKFDGICQIRSNDLMLANRIASLTLVGWRIFACFSRVVLARANSRECDLRIAIEKQTTGTSPTQPGATVHSPAPVTDQLQ